MEQNLKDDGLGELLGRRMSMATVREVVDRVSGDGTAIAQLCRMAMDGAGQRGAMYAAWVLTHLSGQDKQAYVAPFRDELTDALVAGRLAFRPGLLLALLYDLPEPDEPRTDLLDYCMEGLADPRYRDGCRSAMIRLAARMCRAYPELVAELHLRLQNLPPGQPPSICTARKNAMKPERRKRG